MIYAIYETHKYNLPLYIEHIYLSTEPAPAQKLLRVVNVTTAQWDILYRVRSD